VVRRPASCLHATLYCKVREFVTLFQPIRVSVGL
jgi:hypothetical protein